MQDGKEGRCKTKESDVSANLSLCFADSHCNWQNPINMSLTGFVELNICTQRLLLRQSNPKARKLFAR